MSTPETYQPNSPETSQPNPDSDPETSSLVPSPNPGNPEETPTNPTAIQRPEIPIESKNPENENSDHLEGLSRDMGQSKIEPETIKIKELFAVPPKKPKFRVGRAETIGHRPSMEDQTVIYSSEDGELHFFAVFDGHGGSTASKFCSEHLHPIVSSLLNDSSAPEEKIKEAFFRCNDKLRELNSCSETGTTAVVAISKGDQLWVANVGDSRAVLSKDGKAERITTDHKPTTEFERKRIEALKGFVFFGRVNGVLAVSRALGDFNFHPHVTCEPDIFGPYNVENSSNQFLILACDGLWDVIDDNGAVQIVVNSESVEKGAQDLVSSALAARSMDNISVVVIYFPNFAAQKE